MRALHDEHVLHAFPPSRSSLHPFACTHLRCGTAAQKASDGYMMACMMMMAPLDDLQIPFSAWWTCMPSLCPMTPWSSAARPAPWQQPTWLQVSHSIVSWSFSTSASTVCQL